VTNTTSKPLALSFLFKVETSQKKGKHGTPTDISQTLVEATASHVK
jgi:hypothetical protein